MPEAGWKVYNLDLVLTQGEDFVLVLKLQYQHPDDPAGTYRDYDVTGWGAAMQFRDKAGGTVRVNLATDPSVGGLTYTVAGALLTARIPRAQTALLPAKVLHYDLFLVPLDDVAKPWFAGDATVQAGITVPSVVP